MTKLIIRFFDFVLSITGLLISLPLLILVTLMGYLDTGSPIFLQKRVGRDKHPFTLIKFRTMSIDTVSVASHLANAASITKLGVLLRKTKLDEFFHFAFTALIIFL